MNCPVCDTAMVVLEHAGIEVDFCSSCRGVWLDHGELELLFGDKEACTKFLTSGNPRPAHQEKKRRCPVCRRKMMKATTPSMPPVLFDRCPRSDGLWFDKGELADVLQHRTSLGEEGDTVAAFLVDVFSSDAT